MGEGHEVGGSDPYWPLILREDWVIERRKWLGTVHRSKGLWGGEGG